MLAERLKKSNLLLFTGLLLLVTGLPLSLFLTSISQFVLAGSFFLEGEFRNKIERLKQNKLALIFLSFWLIHALGLLWTTDMNEGIKDLRIKLPFLILPIVLGSCTPLSEKQFRTILYVFITAIFSGTMVSLFVLAGWTGHVVHDIRDVFIFNISHIRFALLTCVAIFSLYWLIRHSLKGARKWIAWMMMLWFLLFLFIIESVTGLMVLSITVFVLLIQFILRLKSMTFRIPAISFIFLIPAIAIFLLINWIWEQQRIKEFTIDTTTLTYSGRPYYFDMNANVYENGYPVWVYLCEEEMRATWNSRSAISYDSLDIRGQALSGTLIRFLSSKGWKKDSAAVASLSEKEVIAIEQGIANVLYQDKSSIKTRLLQIAWEIDQYRNGKNPSGHSVTQRLEFWKAACGIIRANPFTGVGTGDLKSAYQDEYERIQTRLEPEYRLRAHNQYLTFAVAFGIPLSILLLVIFIYPILFKDVRSNFLFYSFWLTSILSMITEDTMETQIGATYIAFFYCFFLFLIPASTKK